VLKYHPFLFFSCPAGPAQANTFLSGKSTGNIKLLIEEHFLPAFKPFFAGLSLSAKLFALTQL
jgi:hypothetical protein